MALYHRQPRRFMATLWQTISWLLKLSAVTLMLSLPAAAVEPDEVLKDPALEARARALSTGLRCLVCQNQSIDDSGAQIARDIRLLVRERIAQGNSDGEVMAFLTERYGDFILLRPPFKLATALLWGLPFALVVAGATLLWRRRSGELRPPAPLSPEEAAKLKHLLDKPV